MSVLIYFHDFNFLNVALDHIGPYRAIQDSNDPYWSTWDRSGPNQTKVFPIEHYSSWGTIWNMEPCRTVRDNIESYWDHTNTNGSNRILGITCM